jgi:hypothetical protein
MCFRVVITARSDHSRMNADRPTNGVHGYKSVVEKYEFEHSRLHAKPCTLCMQSDFVE